MKQKQQQQQLGCSTIKYYLQFLMRALKRLPLLAKHKLAQAPYHKSLLSHSITCWQMSCFWIIKPTTLWQRFFTQEASWHHGAFKNFNRCVFFFFSKRERKNKWGPKRGCMAITELSNDVLLSLWVGLSGKGGNICQSDLEKMGTSSSSNSYCTPKTTRQCTKRWKTATTWPCLKTYTAVFSR